MNISDSFKSENDPDFVSVKGFEREDFKDLTKFYQTKLEVNNHEASLELVFLNGTTNTGILSTLNDFILKMNEIDKRNLEYINARFHIPDSEVREYIYHHSSASNNAKSGTIIESKDTTLIKEQELLGLIKLHRVEIIPDHYKEYATFDYTIGRELTQYLIVITTEQNGQITDITIES